MDVKLEDQQKINTFSRLNTKLHELEAQIVAKKVGPVRARRERPRRPAFVLLLAHRRISCRISCPGLPPTLPPPAVGGRGPG